LDEKSYGKIKQGGFLEGEISSGNHIIKVERCGVAGFFNSIVNDKTLGSSSVLINNGDKLEF
jgi:hypothetical protein